MVMGGVACPRGCEFDSHCHMLDGSSLLTFFVVLMWGYDAVMTLLSPRFTYTVGADQRHVGCDNLFYCRSVGLYTVRCTGTLVCMYFEIFVFGSSCHSLFLISLPLFFLFIYFLASHPA